MMVAARIRIVQLEAGMPSAEDARSRLNAEINKARNSDTVVLKLIHGYGSSGVGGRLRDAIRSSLRKRRKEGKIRSFVGGENWSIFEDVTRQILDECAELSKDKDLNGYNEGITIVLI